MAAAAALAHTWVAAAEGIPVVAVADFPRAHATPFSAAAAVAPSILVRSNLLLHPTQVMAMSQ